MLEWHMGRRSQDALRDELRKVAERYAKLFKDWGATGGKARAKRLTAEERREIAQKAARARWKKRPR